MKKIVLFFILILVYSSCEDFDEINQDPNNPVTADPFELLPTGQLSYGFVFANNLNRITSTFVQQLNNFRYEFYNLSGGDVVNDWNTLYRGLRNLEEVIEKGAENEALQYVGVGKIQSAYVYSMMVDLWGDIPFQEASEGEENLSPAFQDAEEIYNDIFEMLDEGIADINNSTGPILNDLIYEGNKQLWIKMANTLKLKLYNQIRLVDPQRAREGITQLLETDVPLINENEENFEFPYYNNTTPENRNPYFQSSYVSKGENYLATTFDEIMQIGSDPRYPYYIYQQAPDFIGRYPADNLSDRGGDEDDRSVIGIYPAGGLYDDGGTVIVTGESAKGNAPIRLITYFMRKFIEAEAALTLNTPGDPRELLEEGIQASFDDINDFVRGEAPPLEQDTIDFYINDRLAAYDTTSTDEQRLEIIMTEKYKALVGNGIEMYTDYRRTGYPVLNEPLSPEGPFPLRLPYQSDEMITNPNAPENQPSPTEPVFWDIN